MADQFSTTTTRGFGSRIVDSFKAMVFGLLMFIASFVVIYMNEGRFDFSTLAKQAQVIESTAPAAEGSLVAIRGNLTTTDSISDNLYLKPQNVLGLSRKVEMYSWIEEEKSTTKKNVGGSETTEKTYTYTMEWTDSPEDSANFAQPSGHENPQKNVDDLSLTATTASEGIYQINLNSLELPEYQPLSLNTGNTSLTPGSVLTPDNYIFISKLGTTIYTTPSIGDLRISFSILPNNAAGVVYGKVRGTNLEPYLDADNNQLFRFFYGTPEQAVATLHGEFVFWLWIVRLIGFLLMWFGMMAVFGPLTTMMDVLPIFGSLGRGAVGIMTFIIALPLAIVTILLSALFHRPIVLLIVAIIAIALVFGLRKYIKQKGEQKPAATI